MGWPLRLPLPSLSVLFSAVALSAFPRLNQSSVRLETCVILDPVQIVAMLAFRKKIRCDAAIRTGSRLLCIQSACSRARTCVFSDGGASAADVVAADIDQSPVCPLRNSRQIDTCTSFHPLA